MLVPCVLIHYYKRKLLQAKRKNKNCQGPTRNVRFFNGVSNDQNQATHDDTTCMNVYEPPACINGSSMLYESVYLQTCFDETTVEDNLTNMVTSHSYPITSSEQRTIQDDQSNDIVLENTYAVQIDPEVIRLEYQPSLELGDSSAHGKRSSDRK